MGAKHSRQNVMLNEQFHRRESVQQHSQIHHQQTSTITSIKSKSANSITIDGRQYHHDETGTYALPRDESEQDRLNSQHFSLKALYDNQNVLPSVQQELPHNAEVLDIGCGSGCWVMEMAIDHPQYHITGLDMADMFPTTIRPENVKFELHNIVNGLPYPDDTFDYVNMRLLVVSLKTNEWPLVISEIFRVLKPGGLVQLVESDFTEKSNIQIVETFNTEFIKALQQAGQDPWIGSKLSTILTETKFEVLQVDTRNLDYGLPLNPIEKEMYQNWKTAMLSIKHLVAHRLCQNTDLYPTIVDRYMEGITQANWKVKIWAVAGQKPTTEDE